MEDLFANARRVLGQASRTLPAFRGKMRAIHCVDKAFRRMGASRLVASDVGGVMFCLDTADLIDFSILYMGGHQRFLVDYMARRIGPGPATIWDIGANVGSISLPLARARQDVEIHSFEPSPSVFARLSRNLSLNPALATRVHLHQCALSDQTGEAAFFPSSEAFNSGVGGLAPAPNRESSAVITAVKRGDDAIRDGIARPVFIKIDVEGFEGEVLRGLEAHLHQANDLEIVFEHSPYRFCQRSRDPREVVDFLRSIGYQVQCLTLAGGVGYRPLLQRDLECSCDLVARKSF